MNTKDNQEAEREAFEELKFIDEKLRQSKKLDMAKVYGGWFLKHEDAIRATLTTPQVNEEVASGEAVGYLVNYRETTKSGNIKNCVQCSLEPHEPFIMPDDEVESRVLISAKPLYLHPPTSSSSNVLVEALREALGALANARFLTRKYCPNHHWNAGLDRDIQKVKQAVATYSASTDSALPNEEVK